MPGNLGAFVQFDTLWEWQAFILGFSLKSGIPRVVTDEFDLAQKLHLLAWLDCTLIKPGELMALTTLELALQDRYGGRFKEVQRARASQRPPKKVKTQTAKAQKIHTTMETVPFAALAHFMVNHDGQTDEQLPIIRRAGGTVIGLLRGDRDPNLAEIRNIRAHGNPFGAGPQAGLLELARDLIEYAYRDLIAEHARLDGC